MSPILVQVPDSQSSPGLARRRVLTSLADTVPPGLAEDVGLLVSELVTNSVRHAHVGAGTIEAEVWLLAERLRLTVSDPGGDTVPHVVAPDLARPGGLGLFLVERLSSSWGVKREPDGVVRVWCEIPLDVALRPDIALGSLLKVLMPADASDERRERVSATA